MKGRVIQRGKNERSSGKDHIAPQRMPPERKDAAPAMSRSFAALPDVMTPHDLIAFLPIGRNGVYDAIRSERIASVRVGQKLLVTKAALKAFLGGAVE